MPGEEVSTPRLSSLHLFTCHERVSDFEASILQHAVDLLVYYVAMLMQHIGFVGIFLGRQGSIGCQR